MTNLKLAFRRLFKAPFVTSVAILSLALGIGANAAIFSLFNQMLLRPLPVPAPHELVNLQAPGPKPGSQSCNQAGNCENVFSYAMFRDLQKAHEVFTDIAAHVLFGANLAFHNQTLNGQGVLVSGSYFPVLGLTPAIGRLLSPQDDQKLGESPVVVLSHAYWTSRFDRNPNVIGDTLIVNGQHLTIVGVAPEGFDGTTLGAKPQVFVPMTLRGLMNPGFNQFHNRRSYWAYLFARLRPGATIEQARTQLNVPYHAIINDVEAPLQRGMSDQTMARFKARQVLLEPGARGQTSVDREARVPLLLLLSVTGLVLLIACANIANLLLARAAARSSEMAIRLSIGANRRQLIGQLLTESVVLAVIGGLAGLLVSRWTLDLIFAMLPNEAAETLQVTIDGTVLLFAGGVTIATGLLFGLFPAWHSTNPNLLTTLKGQAGQPGGGKSAKWFRASLATVQIAISMALLVCAGLFTKSLVNVSRVELGINVQQLATFGVSPELNGYSAERSKQLFERLEELLAAQPGVTGISASTRAVAGRQQLGDRRRGAGIQVGAGHRQQLPLQRGRTGLFQDDGYSAPRRSRIRAVRSSRRSEGGHRQRGVRKEVQPGYRRGRQADERRRRAVRKAGHRDRRAGEGRQVQRGERRDPAALLPSLPAGREGRLDDVLRAHRRARPNRLSRRSSAWWRASIRICRSRTSTPWSSRSATTSSSIG